jgi:hypothetical protein
VTVPRLRQADAALHQRSADQTRHLAWRQPAPTLPTVSNMNIGRAMKTTAQMELLHSVTGFVPSTGQCQGDSPRRSGETLLNAIAGFVQVARVGARRLDDPQRARQSTSAADAPARASACGNPAAQIPRRSS